MMLEEILSALGRHWPIAVSVLLLAYLAKNHFNHGLNKYPGPVLAGLSDWWRFFDVYGRRPDITHLKLHRQHGDIVRLGPNVLSFSDPKAIKQIYGLNRGFVKVSLHAHVDTLFTRLTQNSPTSIPCKWEFPKASVCLHYSRQLMKATTRIFVGL